MIYIPINSLDETCHHLSLSGLAKGLVACQILIEPDLHNSIIVNPNHSLIHCKAPCPSRKLRKSLQASIEDVQVIRIWYVFHVLETDGDALNEQGMPGRRGAEIILGVGLKVVGGYEEGVASAYFEGLPLQSELVIILGEDFVLLEPLKGVAAALPDLKLRLLLPLLPLGRPELIVVDFAILAAH
jgi:hypothetical protein